MIKLKDIYRMLAWVLGFVALPLGGIALALYGVVTYSSWAFIAGLAVIILSMYVWVFYGPSGKSTWRKYD